MITFALLIAALISVVLLPCMFANLLRNLRSAARRREAVPAIALTPKMA